MQSNMGRPCRAAAMLQPELTAAPDEQIAITYVIET